MQKAFRLALVSLLALPLSALAAPSFTLNQPNQTVTRPTTGTSTVTFAGTLTLDAGDFVNQINLLFPFDSAGHVLVSQFSGTEFDTGDSDRFTITVNSTTPLGLYEFDFTLVNPATIEFIIFDVNGATHTLSAAYSLDVVAAAAPEPAILSLLGLGLAGLAVTRRRKLH